MNHIKVMPIFKPKTSSSISKLDKNIHSANTKFITKRKIALKHKNTNKEDINIIENIIEDIDVEVKPSSIVDSNEQDNLNKQDELDDQDNHDELDESNEQDEGHDIGGHRSRKRHKNYGRETRYNKKKIEFEFGVSSSEEITGQQETLMIPLTSFFQKNNNIERILPILKGQSPISLRIIDWFVTNYSKERGTFYNLDIYKNRQSNENNNNKTDTKFSIVSNFDALFFVHYDYRCQLKSFYKKKFDPFCRKTKIQFYYQPDKYIITTVGQLNFFRWAIKNYVLDYIEECLEKIEKHMNDNIKVAKVIEYIDNKTGITTKPKSPKNNSLLIIGQTQKRRKRKEISPSCMRSITKYESPVTINFD